MSAIRLGQVELAMSTLGSELQAIQSHGMDELLIPLLETELRYHINS
jgi:hypothetical protein